MRPSELAVQITSAILYVYYTVSSFYMELYKITNMWAEHDLT